MLPKTGKNRKLTNGSSRMELIGDLAKNQFSEVMGGENRGVADGDNHQHTMRSVSLGKEAEKWQRGWRGTQGQGRMTLRYSYVNRNDSGRREDLTMQESGSL